MQKPDGAARETTNDDDEITIQRANGSGNDGKYKNNEGCAIKSTCETENVIIVHEKHRSGSTSAAESAINNKLSEEKETNLAIEMLDTVLEGEEESDSVETEINSRRESTQSINRKDANVPVIALTRDFSYESSPKASPTEAKNLEIIDPEYIRSEIETVIDDVLECARASVAEIELARLNEIQSDDDDENVFKNRKFLTHLSDLILKSNQQTSPSRLNVQSKTLGRKQSSDAKKERNLKHSKSVPDFKILSDSAEEKAFHDDTRVDYTLSDDGVSESNNDVNESAEPSEFVPPPAPVFSAELFGKVATLKRKEQQEEADKNIIQDDDGDTKSLEDEPVDKENFRDKLEKLLAAPPSRLSLIAPIPLPRMSLAKNPSKDNHEQHPSTGDVITPLPISATMLRQRQLFDEVLKKFAKNENEYS